ncbi:uncharacterized protein MONOS_9922 [Monocercomonoides exilis]|uniref:uncharacterized protein n=1 Tax=Monocercomonoides exilis TaxID=2049356 RepID=UPI00355AC05B|nr:hypothetical protein MONOS_9922 [Monocercomonoides exilis]|eukprot:MONOS_9922.1-p1 / transcript=MONOS_9922.1 / gene=MONOS_9922 / organism=Monocercomonoides_exilis_PA203 / gene_product=unspecified product / transcript_product=unspecified product / location=Mono_scaffold00427:32946-33230(+) / protein_length=95 / sequence_SO=supercontig / SO=protein_coding / is_pseudo=false
MRMMPPPLTHLKGQSQVLKKKKKMTNHLLPSSLRFFASGMAKLISMLLLLKKTRKTKALSEETTAELHQPQEAFRDTPPRLPEALPATQTQHPH